MDAPARLKKVDHGGVPERFQQFVRVERGSGCAATDLMQTPGDVSLPRHRCDVVGCGCVRLRRPGRPSTDLVNAYPNGTYHYTEPPKAGQTATFTNEMASWGGTSFATPIVAGMIAARMSHTGQSGRRAADSILRIARRHGVGGIGAIADPSMALDLAPFDT